MSKIFNLPSTIFGYLQSVLIELRRVDWLSFKQVSKATLIVIVMTILFVVVVSGMDSIFVTLRSIVLTVI